MCVTASVLAWDGAPGFNGGDPLIIKDDNKKDYANGVETHVSDHVDEVHLELHWGSKDAEADHCQLVAVES